MEETSNESSQQDRLSVLPTSLLHHIASFLPMHTVVQTCVFSKSWRNFWCSVPTFNIPYAGDYVTRVMQFVKSALFLRDGSDIQNLDLSLPGNYSDFTELSEWIIYAVRHNVQVVTLNIFGSDLNGIKLPLFKSASLKKLTLFYNKCLNLPASIFLPELKTLKLKFVLVQDGLLDVLLSATPSLKNLILVNCVIECSHLTISSAQLKKLTLERSCSSAIVISAPMLISLKLDMDGSFPSVVIYAPNLLSLGLVLSPQKPASIKINDSLVSLTDAVIDIHGICAESALHLISMAKNARSLYLKSTNRSGAVFLFSPFVKELERDLSLLNQIEMPFLNLKFLRIDTLFSSAEISFIFHILKQSPQIEDLFLNSNSVVQDWSKAIQIEHCQDNKVWSKYELSHLKSVEIKGFKGSNNEMKVVEFLLENAIILENLIITVAMCEKRSSAHNKEILKIGKQLVRLPRASSSVGVLYLR